jgi:hypothetical protein
MNGSTGRSTPYEKNGNNLSGEPKKKNWLTPNEKRFRKAKFDVVINLTIELRP